MSGIHVYLLKKKRATDIIMRDAKRNYHSFMFASVLIMKQTVSQLSRQKEHEQKDYYVAPEKWERREKERKIMY